MRAARPCATPRPRPTAARLRRVGHRAPPACPPDAQRGGRGHLRVVLLARPRAQHVEPLRGASRPWGLALRLDLDASRRPPAARRLPLADRRARPATVHNIVLALVAVAAGLLQHRGARRLDGSPLRLPKRGPTPLESASTGLLSSRRSFAKHSSRPPRSFGREAPLARGRGERPYTIPARWSEQYVRATLLSCVTRTTLISSVLV